jgi:hypothetical protein
MKPLLTHLSSCEPDPATDLVLPESDHAALLIKAQPLHIQQLIQNSINWFLKEITFEKGFPLVKDKWAMAINALRDNADNMGLREVRDRLYWDMKYAYRLASIVCDLAGIHQSSLISYHASILARGPVGHMAPDFQENHPDDHYRRLWPEERMCRPGCEVIEV